MPLRSGFFISLRIFEFGIIMGSVGTNSCLKTESFFSGQSGPKRPTSLVIGLEFQVSSRSNIVSPLGRIGSPMGRVGSPLCFGTPSTPRTPVTFMSEIGTPLTPGAKRKPAETDLLKFHSNAEFGPSERKMFMVDPDNLAPNVRLQADGYIAESDGEDDEWNPSAPPLPKLSPPARMSFQEMKSVHSPLTPNREFPGRVKIPKRRLGPATPSTEYWTENESWD